VARIILVALETLTDVVENQTARDLIWRANFRWRL
jgi:hypothetical protein